MSDVRSQIGDSLGSILDREKLDELKYWLAGLDSEERQRFLACSGLAGSGLAKAAVELRAEVMARGIERYLERRS